MNSEKWITKRVEHWTRSIEHFLTFEREALNNYETWSIETRSMKSAALKREALNTFNFEREALNNFEREALNIF